MKRSRRKKSANPMSWVWEFSKKLVIICSALYVFSFFYSCVVMWRFLDFTYLGTYIEQASDILKTCVFGYFIKAGIENVFKIVNSKFEQKEQHETNKVLPDSKE